MIVDIYLPFSPWKLEEGSEVLVISVRVWKFIICISIVTIAMYILKPSGKNLVSEISRFIMVDCLLVLLNILTDQLKDIMLDLHRLVIVEQFRENPEHPSNDFSLENDHFISVESNGNIFQRLTWKRWESKVEERLLVPPLVWTSRSFSVKIGDHDDAPQSSSSSSWRWCHSVKSWLIND